MKNERRKREVGGVRKRVDESGRVKEIGGGGVKIVGE